LCDPKTLIRADCLVVRYSRVRREVRRLSRKPEDRLIERPLCRTLTDRDPPQVRDVLGEPGFQVSEAASRRKLQRDPKRRVGEKPGLHYVGPGHPDVHKGRLKRRVVQQSEFGCVLGGQSVSQQLLDAFCDSLRSFRVVDMNAG